MGYAGGLLNVPLISQNAVHNSCHIQQYDILELIRVTQLVKNLTGRTEKGKTSRGTAGHAGGEKLKDERGPEYFKEIGAKGGESRKGSR
jgi:hypothetical protein